MEEITLTLNGSQVSDRQGMTILELAKKNGIDIPTLCHVPELSPTGSCRICVVEVEGSRTLVGSCHTPIAPGMVINTHSPKVLETRKVIMELLLASHAGFCVVCNKANVCELRNIMADLEIGLPRFQTRKRYYPLEDISPYVERDLSKCILCRKCIMVCSKIAKQDIYSTGYRGFGSKIVVDLDQPLNKEVCRDCGLCIPVCPTGALSKPRKISEEKQGKSWVVSG